MKSNQRLEYGRIAEVLAERDMVDPQALRDLLQATTNGGRPFAEALIDANLVSDWELSAVVCELYNLPFLPVDIVTPSEDAREGIDVDYLRENDLVPISRHANVLTIAMPAIVPAEVLGLLAAETDLYVLPVVGTVRTNRRWIEEHLAPDVPADGAESWGSIFDEADTAVMLELESTDEVEEPDASSGSEVADKAEVTLPPPPSLD